MTADATPDDPFGYRRDLDEVLEYPTPDAPNPVPVVLALARCAAFGVPVPEDVTARARRHLPAVVPVLLAEIDGRTEAARTLGERYDRTDDPWEADSTVRALVEFRAVALGLELVAATEFGAAVRRFDAALREHADLIGSAAESAWFENLRLDLPAEVAAAEWWLNPVADPVDLPPPEYYATVRRVRYARVTLPDPVEAPALAAAVLGDAPPPPTTFRWRSPDGRGEARLNVPAVPTTADESVSRPLKLFRDGEPADGLPIRIGNVARTTGANGHVKLTLAELRANWDGRLFVGSPEVEWPLLADDAE